MNTEENFLIILLKEPGLLFSSWKIDSSDWEKILSSSSLDSNNEPYLVIKVYSINNGEQIEIDAIPVHGMENNWHIFTKDNYHGKRIILILCYQNIEGNYVDVLTSGEIDIPLPIPEAFDNSGSEKSLYELAEIDLFGFSGSGNNTSW